MTYSITAIDRAALPAELLPVAKDHLRIDFDDDDATITRHLQWAISYLEIFWSQRIFAATVRWAPPTELGWARYQAPLQPVSLATVMSGGLDVSAEYALESISPVHPVWLVHSDLSAFPADAVVTLTVGFATVDDIEPAAVSGILRWGATLYENRESVSSISLDQMPFWMNDVLGGLWIPRA